MKTMYIIMAKYYNADKNVFFKEPIAFSMSKEEAEQIIQSKRDTSYNIPKYGELELIDFEYMSLPEANNQEKEFYVDDINKFNDTSEAIIRVIVTEHLNDTKEPYYTVSVCNYGNIGNNYVPDIRHTPEYYETDKEENIYYTFYFSSYDFKNMTRQQIEDKMIEHAKPFFKQLHDTFGYKGVYY